MSCWSLYIKKRKSYLDIRSRFKDIIRIMDTVKNVRNPDIWKNTKMLLFK